MTVLSATQIPTPDFLQSPEWGWVCCLDYDGNLTPIVKTPEAAVLTEERASFLRQLSDCPNTIWAIVTGRSVAQMHGFLNPHGLKPHIICGLHGGEVYLPQTDQWLRQPDESLIKLSDAFMETVHQDLKAEFSVDDIKSLGLALEPKKYSFALHYRAVTDDDIGIRAHRVFDAAYAKAAEISRIFRVQPGKRVVEIVPATFNKGDGIRFLLQYLSEHPDVFLDKGSKTPKVSFMGDDKTDEPGFEAANESGGVSVRVALPDGETTTATYQIADVDDVYALLSQWVQARTTSSSH